MYIYMTAIQDIFCVAVFLHRSVQNLVWNICLLTEFANQNLKRKIIPCSNSNNCNTNNNYSNNNKDNKKQTTTKNNINKLNSSKQIPSLI